MTLPRQGITRFGLSNFKAFHHMDDIELRPLTVLVGPNSSGKSSILQSLALLGQTLRSGHSGEPVLFDGEFVNLQSYETIVSMLDPKRTIEYRFETESYLTNEVAQYHFPEYSNQFSSSDKVIRLASKITLRIGNFSQIEKANPPDFTVSAWLPDFMPAEKAIAVAKSDDDAGEIMHSALLPLEKGLQAKNLKIKDYIFDNIFPKSVNIDLSDEKPFAKILKLPLDILKLPLDIFIILKTAFDSVENMLNQRLDYLGPVRADPKPFYPITQDLEIGSRGEGAIPYLLIHQNEFITYRTAPTDEPCKSTFLSALNHWLGKMGVTSKLSVDLIPNIAYTAKLPSVAAPEKTVSLAQVGFGISQLLPVLMLGLKEPSDGFLLYEQPEIHLHPRMQADLGDFFLSVARQGKTILLETHSDYLVNRLRRRVAEDPTGELAKLVNILFVHPGTSENPSSYVEPLEIGADGSIQNCPADFFSEGADESFAILRARANKAPMA